MVVWRRSRVMEETLDKYERKVRVNQIISLIDKGEYGEALEIADTIDWRTEKSIKTLRVVSEVYKINRRYEDAFNVLTIAYEKEPDDPIKRKIVYDLCEIAIKLNQYAYAVKYMKEFAALSPNDPGRYVLQYKLLKVTGAEYAERIEVLEEFKQNYFGDFREKWAYELAQLYHVTGQSQQCINACDEIILWFVKGPYVTKAKELKNSYQNADAGMGYSEAGNAGSSNNARQDYSGNGGFGYTEEQTGYYDQNSGYSGSGYDQSDYGGYQPSMQIEIKNVYASNEPTIRMPDQQISDAAYAQAPDEVSINIDKNSTINLQAELKANLDDLAQKTGEPIRQREESIPEPDEGMTELFDTSNMSGGNQEPYYYDQQYDAQQYQQPYGQQSYQGSGYPEQPYGGSPYETPQYDAQGFEGQPYGMQPEAEQIPEPEEPREYERKFPEDEKAEPVVAEVDRAAFVRNVPVFRQSPSGETLYRTEETQKPIVIKKTDFGESLPRMPQQYRNILSEDYAVTAAAVVRRNGDTLSISDGFNLDSRASGHMYGWIIGLFLGMFFSFTAMLICGLTGSLIGTYLDHRRLKNSSALLQSAAQELPEGRTALIMLADETNEEAVNDRLAKFDVSVDRIDAAKMQAEIDALSQQKRQHTAA